VTVAITTLLGTKAFTWFVVAEIERFNLASAAATIAIDFITIIAFFIISQNAITTHTTTANSLLCTIRTNNALECYVALQLTIRRTTITGHSVAVIAFFVRVEHAISTALLDADAGGSTVQQALPTSNNFAVFAALAIRIAIIALFFLANQAIAMDACTILASGVAHIAVL